MLNMLNDEFVAVGSEYKPSSEEEAESEAEREEEAKRKEKIKLARVRHCEKHKLMHKQIIGEEFHFSEEETQDNGKAPPLGKQVLIKK